MKSLFNFSKYMRVVFLYVSIFFPFSIFLTLTHCPKVSSIIPMIIFACLEKKLY